MERWVYKVLALIGTFILPLIATLLPYRLSACINRKGRSGKKVLSYLMCLGGGIFFGTYLLHMGPEVAILLKDSLLMPYNIDYPMAELITGIGFFFVLFAEKLVLRCNQSRMKKRKTSLCLKETEAVEELKVEKLPCRNPNELCDPCIKGLPCTGLDEGEGLNIMSHMNSDDSKRLSLIGGGDGYVTNHNEAVSKVNKVKIDSRISFSSDDSGQGGHHSHLNHHNTRSIVLILALSLHRIFEGMSVGLQKSSHDVIHLFAAVMCHEMVIGFSLGLQFVKSNFPLKRLLVTSLICSFIMPLGVAIGTIMTEMGKESPELELANGVLQAFAMGTFIYVTFFEILQEEIDPEDTSVAKVICIAVGFGLMALLTLIPEEQVEESLLSFHGNHTSNSSSSSSFSL